MECTEILVLCQDFIVQSHMTKTARGIALAERQAGSMIGLGSRGRAHIVVHLVCPLIGMDVTCTEVHDCVSILSLWETESDQASEQCMHVNKEQNAQ